MRIVKLALISFVVLFGLMFFISALLPSQIRISRATNIGASPEKIRTFIGDLRTWSNWNELVKDSILQNPQYDQDIIKSKTLEIELVSNSNNSIRTIWKRGGRKVESGFNIIPSSDDVTIVQWYFDFSLRWYPWEKFASIVFDKQMGPPMEKSLSNLTNSIEELE